MGQEFKAGFAGSSSEPVFGRPEGKDIAAVIAAGGPHVVFQPIVRLDSRRVTGFESLARFNSEPATPPDVWFEAAEDAGMRIDLELAAVRSALASLNHLPVGSYLSINVSPDVATRRELHALLSLAPLERIVIEITEQVRVLSYEGLNEAIADLRAKGLRVAIDDAGAGNAGMAHLVRLRPDVIKLDRSVVQGITYEDGRRALVSSLVSFAIATNATIVAEGIESEAEVTALRELGVTGGQGYLFARPGSLPAVLPAGRAVPREPRRHAGKGDRRRVRFVARLAAAALTAFLLVGPTAAFAQSAEPDNPLWRVKIVLEDLRLTMERDPSRRMNLHMEFASRRVDELAALIDAGTNVGATAAVRKNLEAQIRGSQLSLARFVGSRAQLERARLVAVLGQYQTYLGAQVAGACARRGTSTHQAVCAQARKAADDSSRANAAISTPRAIPSSAHQTGKPASPKPHPSATPDRGNSNKN